ncbi:MAG: hypothetical protein WCS43_14595 [Verrucomicrobiota bacterium]
MKKIIPSKLADQYLTVLRSYFDQRQQPGLLAARDPGRLTVATGLETFDLAKAHDQAPGILLGNP